MKQLEVQIMGQSYLLGCPEGGDGRMLEAVEKVDSAMCKIRDAGKVKARDRIAVLAALNLAFEVPDRAVAAQPAPVAPVTGPIEHGSQAATPASDDAVLSSTDSARLTALLQRLDTVLGDDGQLL